MAGEEESDKKVSVLDNVIQKTLSVTMLTWLAATHLLKVKNIIGGDVATVV